MKFEWKTTYKVNQIISSKKEKSNYMIKEFKSSRGALAFFNANVICKVYLVF